MTLNINASTITIRYEAVGTLLTILGLVIFFFALFIPSVALTWVFALIGAAVAVSGIVVGATTYEVTANDLR